MSAEQEKFGEELSVYGQILDGLQQIRPVKRGDCATLTFDADEGTPKRADFVELADLIKQGELTLDDLKFLYHVIREAIHAALTADDVPPSLSVVGDYVFINLMRIISKAEIVIREMNIMTPDLLKTYATIRSLYERRPDFIKKIVDAACNDAVVRLKMEETCSAVDVTMGQGGDDFVDGNEDDDYLPRKFDA